MRHILLLIVTLTVVSLVPRLNDAAPGSGAPTNVSYVTRVAEGGLTNETALASLASGLLRVTTGTGGLSSLAFSGLVSDVLRGNGTMGPLFNQSLNSTDSPTFASITVGACNGCGGSSADNPLAHPSIAVGVSGQGVQMNGPSSGVYPNQIGHYFVLKAASGSGAGNAGGDFATESGSWCDGQTTACHSSAATILFGGTSQRPGQWYGKAGDSNTAALGGRVDLLGGDNNVGGSGGTVYLSGGTSVGGFGGPYPGARIQLNGGTVVEQGSASVSAKAWSVNGKPGVSLSCNAGQQVAITEVTLGLITGATCAP